MERRLIASPRLGAAAQTNTPEGAAQAFLKRRGAGSSDSQSTNRFPFDFEGRHLALTWWGGHGIGANDWKDADLL
jgi:hypothetical protein